MGWIENNGSKLRATPKGCFVADFITGLALNELFYKEVMASIMKSHFSGLPYPAALIGWGSEVLGYDDVQSSDHNWCLRFQLFLSEQDYEEYREAIDSTLSERLPSEFRGFLITAVALTWSSAMRATWKNSGGLSRAKRYKISSTVLAP
jgi:hypothetical protein